MRETEQVSELFKQFSGEYPSSISPLPQSGSDRHYFRLKNKQEMSFIAATNPDKKENEAFLSFTKHFRNKGFPVPDLYYEDIENACYLLEDLGDETLFSFSQKVRTSQIFPRQLINIYKTILEFLPKFQIEGYKGLDFSVCYPRDSFDKQSMMWDMSYFKYYFLKLAHIPFDEQLLEDDFNRLSGFLLQVDCEYFLYRDFQSRNIMLRGETLNPWFIDYQGGRKGALQYDLASLLWDGKADIPYDIRTYLLEYYLDQLEKYIPVNRSAFTEYYYGYVLIRIMQAMGSYGYRGFYERKRHFLQSIPFSLKNIAWILKNVDFPIELPTLFNVLEVMLESKVLKKFTKNTQKSNLMITINSFSYQKGIPEDPYGHGGGFVFDCRGIHNPGHYDEYKHFTGKDEEVIRFFRKESDMDDFLSYI
ncbi:MAG: RNase adapter RapZ, partial [Candidatus Marinimicrobia bacterium]|nr:RNase adapter RapZ [Candidatus Neomarinimicrobiota bacterium]